MKFTPKTLDAYKLMHEGILSLARAERNGIYCDVDYCKGMIKHLDRQMSRMESKLKDSEFITKWRQQYGQKFNMGSNTQLADMLYNVMGLEPTAYTAKGNPSTDADALSSIDIPEIQDMLRIKELEKAKTTYLEGFLREQVDGVIHTNFNLHLARSYRPSTDSPNLANVPVRNPEIKQIVRNAIKARPGHKLVCADFKGIEVGVGCPYHQDKNMITYVSDKSTDMHRDAAKDCFIISPEMWSGIVAEDKKNKTTYAKDIRQEAKGDFVFSQFYGDWYKSCAGSMWQASFALMVSAEQTLNQHLHKQGIKNLEKFEQHIQKCENILWNERHPDYTKWKKNWLITYEKNGYFDTLTGFRCSGVMDRKRVCNYPIQGSAFHIMLQCIIWLDEIMLKEGWDSRICNQIYDDIMVDCHPDEEQLVKDTMNHLMTTRIKEHWQWINVPLEVEFEQTGIDQSWYHKH